MTFALGDDLLLSDGRTVFVTDIPEGNEDAAEDLLIVATHSDPETPIVINPFQVDRVLSS